MPLPNPRNPHPCAPPSSQHIHVLSLVRSNDTLSVLRRDTELAPVPRGRPQSGKERTPRRLRIDPHFATLRAMNSLAGKSVLITGAAKRLGAAIARAAHAAGASVVIHYGKSRTQADELCAQLNAVRPQSAHALQADLLDTAA